MITQVRFDMSDFKVGDKVVLRPETKPYGYKSVDGGSCTLSQKPNEDLIYYIIKIYVDGDIEIKSSESYNRVSVSPHHLKHVANEIEDSYSLDLRLEIFKTNPSLSVSEMQDIEKWLLNK